MDVASAIFAVGSLSFQLAQSVKCAKGVLRDVRNAPDELARLTGALDQLELLLIQVKVYIEQQSRSEGLTGSIDLVQNALVNSESTIQRLTKLANTLQIFFERPGRVQKLWASVKTVLKREDLARLQSQVDENMRNLQTSILINMSNLHLRQTQLMSNNHLLNSPPSQQDFSADMENKVTERNELGRVKSDIITSSGKTDVLLYMGLFGSIRIQTRTKIETIPCEKPKRAISRIKSIIIAPCFARSVFELRSEDCLGRMSRTMTSFPVLPISAEIFNWFKLGELDRAKAALNRREISPFVRDPYGRTLLHYACSASSLEICSMLIRVGVDVNQEDSIGRKAMNFINKANKASLWDITRTVLTAQDDVTLTDISNFVLPLRWPLAPSALAEFFVFTFTLWSYSNRDDDSYEWCLRMALNEWGGGHWDKRVVVRKLLCQGLNVHAIAAPDIVTYVIHVFRESDILTPLDYLFQYSLHPFDSDGIGREWLLMLAEVGYDVRAYLQKEKELHASQCQRTSNAHLYVGEGFCEFPRHLIFQIDPYPSIRWDWWIDPSSAASLVQEEFRYMSIGDSVSGSWEFTWPFEYPVWSENHQPVEWRYPFESDKPKRIAWKQKVSSAQIRLARRAKKKYPEYPYKYNSMPGAWVEDDRQY